MRETGRHSEERCLWDYLEDSGSDISVPKKDGRLRERHCEDTLRSHPQPKQSGSAQDTRLLRKRGCEEGLAMTGLFEGVLKNYNAKTQYGLQVEFYPYASLKHTIRLRNHRYHLRISDIMRDAPPMALEAAAHVMLSKITRRRCPEEHLLAYECYAHSSPILAEIERVQRKRGHKKICGSRGKVRDLEESFDRINKEYFQGKLPRPTLTWTLGRSRTRLGTYDGTFNTISINRKLDSDGVPRYVLDYIMFHEVLHIICPVRIVNGRRVVHSREFRKAERKFRDYDRAIRRLRR